MQASRAKLSAIDGETFAHVAIHLYVQKLAQCVMVSQAFAHLWIEQALRDRRTADSKHLKILPDGFNSWLHKLIWDEVC